MPCQSYEPENSSYELDVLKEHNNKLARVACRLAEALEAGETLEWLILKGDKASKEAVEWYKQHKIEDEKRREKARKAAEAKRKEAAKKKLRAEVIARLTPEEREALGVK